MKMPEQLLRVQCFNVSPDGYGAGEGRTLERPFGHAEPADLFSWVGATASWVNRTEPRGSRGLDDSFTPLHIAVAPVDLERGERLWKSADDLLDRFHLDTVPSPSGVIHLLFWRREPVVTP
jgi:hypothetical protein